MPKHEQPPKSPDWLDRVKKESKLTSDAKLAETLGISKVAISQQRAGKQQMSVRAAVRVAEILRLPLMLVLTSVMFHGDRASNRGFWEGRFHLARLTIQKRSVQQLHARQSQRVEEAPLVLDKADEE